MEALTVCCMGMSVPQDEAGNQLLALGDSYSVGEGVRLEDSWAMQTIGSLELSGIEIIAETGWTTDELAAAVAARRLRGPFALVSLLIGVNSQYRGRPLDEYRAQFAELLKNAIGLAGGGRERVIVLSIPDWGVTPFAEGRDRDQIAREIDAFNAVNLSESRRQRVHYVDVTPISRRAATEPELLAPDGLHPSAIMYEEWAELVVPVAREALRS